MPNPHDDYFLELYKAVLAGVQRNESPLYFSNRIHKAVNPFLAEEFRKDPVDVDGL